MHFLNARKFVLCILIFSEFVCFRKRIKFLRSAPEQIVNQYARGTLWEMPEEGFYEEGKIIRLKARLALIIFLNILLRKRSFALNLFWCGRIR